MKTAYDPSYGLIVGTLLYCVLLGWFLFKIGFFYPFDNLWQMFRGRRKRLAQLYQVNTCKILGHEWETVATNGFFVPIEEKCHDCGEVRHRVLRAEEDIRYVEWYPGRHPKRKNSRKPVDPPPEGFIQCGGVAINSEFVGHRWTAAPRTETYSLPERVCCDCGVVEQQRVKFEGTVGVVGWYPKRVK